MGEATLSTEVRAPNKQMSANISHSAKEQQQGHASWRAAGLEPPADACVNWVSCKKPPLHWEALYSTSSLELRLANMTAALDAGADPNELDHELNVHRGLGRPLHCCLGGYMAWGPPKVIRLNLPLIELLLARGADPRLPGPRYPSPLEMARQEAEDNDNPDEGEKILQDCGFYAEAYKLLKAAADSLDGESPLV
ncbi:hypothetical protein N0V82_005313 [Gnomoniopsis sp. IMI 355080]|nr:hypothetical protein N0V82_005313 [Gnomoniopsis sp. IMI 355080]